MNSELQAQADVLIKAITHLEDTLHRDLCIIIIVLACTLIVVSLIALHRR